MLWLGQAHTSRMSSLSKADNTLQLPSSKAGEESLKGGKAVSGNSSEKFIYVAPALENTQG